MNSTYFIGFSDEAICVASDQIVQNVSLNSITTEFAQKPISTFQLTNQIFNVDTMENPLYFQIKYLVNVESYDNFKIVYQPNTNYSLFNDLIDLFAERIELTGMNDTVKITGSLDLNSTFVFKFYNEYRYSDKAPESLLLSVNDLGQNTQNSFETFFMKLFGDGLSQALLEELTISRGLSQLENLRIKGILLKVYMAGPKQGLAVLNLQVDYVPDFSISPEFILYDCLADYLIFLEGNPLSFTWKFLVDCACKRFENIARMYILRSEGQENIFLNGTRQNLTLKTIEEKLFETGVHKLSDNSTIDNNTDDNNNNSSFMFKQAGFFSEMRTQADLQKYINIVEGLKVEQGNIDDFSTEIFFIPQLTYKVSGSFYISDLLLQGKLHAIVTNIGGTMSSVVHLEFPGITPEKLLKGFLSDQTIQGLEALANVVTPTNLMLLTASRDVDLKNYLFVKTKNLYNETFWEKGVHLSYKFQFNNDCKNNKFCDYMAQKYDPTYNYTLYGELSEQDQLVLLGTPQNNNPTPDPVNFQVQKVQLLIPLIVNSSSTQNNSESNKTINFQLLGDFLLSLEDNKTLHFKSQMSFLKDRIVITGLTEVPWSSALALPPLNLSQISMQAYVDLVSFQVKGLQLSSLAVFGRDCFLQTSNESIFQKSRCFYGDADITVNPNDYHQNYLEGYFPTANIWNILFSGLDYDSFRDYDGISKHISNVKLSNGVDLMYSMQDLVINSTRFKNHSETMEQRKIPSGFSIKGVGNVLGLDGVLLMNIDPILKQVSGVFNLNSAISFAGGNAVVLQTDLNSSDLDNSIIFNMQENEIPEEKQVHFIGKINLFNTQSNLNMTITNDDFHARTHGKIFKGLYDFALELSAPYNQSLQAADFKIKGLFSKDLINDLEVALRNKTVDWVNYVKFILNRLDKKIGELKDLLDSKQKDLCNEDLCPKELQCIDYPHHRCIEYSVKTVCKQQHSFCLKPEQTCVLQQDVCVSQEQVCVNVDNTTNQCIEYKNVCQDYLTICSQWKHICNSETVIACENFSVEVDENNCKRTEFVCKIQEVKDVICQNDCNLRRKQYEKYEKLYENLINAKETFNKKLTGFWIMNSEIQNKPNTFLTIAAGKFEELLTDLVDPRSLKMQISVISFKEDLTDDDNMELVEERNFDFKDQENFVYRLFLKLTKSWSQRFTFDMILLKENEAELLNDLFMTVNQNVEASLATGRVLFDFSLNFKCFFFGF